MPTGDEPHPFRLVGPVRAALVVAVGIALWALAAWITGTLLTTDGGWYNDAPNRGVLYSAGQSSGAPFVWIAAVASWFIAAYLILRHRGSARPSAD